MGKWIFLFFFLNFKKIQKQTHPPPNISVSHAPAPQPYPTPHGLATVLLRYSCYAAFSQTLLSSSDYKSPLYNISVSFSVLPSSKFHHFSVGALVNRFCPKIILKLLWNILCLFISLSLQSGTLIPNLIIKIISCQEI